MVIARSTGARPCNTIPRSRGWPISTPQIWRGALDHAGFKTQRGLLGAAAENVSYGCADEACAIEQWAHSAPHRANMLRKEITRYGIASAVSASGQRYWVMELGGVTPTIRTQRGRKQYMESATKR